MTAWIKLQYWWLGIRVNCLRRKLHRHFERTMKGQG